MTTELSEKQIAGLVQSAEAINDARTTLLAELDDIFGNAMEISCTRLSLAIEALIDAKIAAATSIHQ